MDESCRRRYGLSPPLTSLSTTERKHNSTSCALWSLPRIFFFVPLSGGGGAHKSVCFLHADACPKFWGRDHSAQLVELCFLSIVERLMSGEEYSCRRRQLSSKISALSGLLSISSILSLVLLVFPRPSKGSVWESTQTHVGAGTRALLGPCASAPAVACRFPLSAACTRSALWRS